MANLRAGLIGHGSMGRNHARVLRELDGVELVAIVDPALAENHDDLYATMDEFLDRRIDYCVVAAPTVQHEPIGLTLAGAGIHAIIEKPLAQDPESAKRLADAFETKGLVGAVGHIERFNPALQQARRRMAAGELGEIHQIATRRQGPFPARIADVGVVKDLATHDIDLTAWIAQSQFERVAAQTAYRSGRQFEDLVTVSGRLANGIITSHLVNWLSPFKERVTVITGDKGAFIASTLTADLTFHANGTVSTVWEDVAQFRGVSEGDMVRYAFPKPEPLRLEHETFRDAVLGLETEIVTMRQGLATVTVAEAIIESARAGVMVVLEGS